MVDFPPNLEDGESWLPPDILHEIASPNTKPHRIFTDNAAPSRPTAHAFSQPNSSAARPLPNVSPYFEIRGPFRSIEASGRGAVGNGVTPFPLWNGGVQGVPGSINLYNSFTPFQNQGFENLGVMVFPGQQNCTWPPVQVNRHEIYGFAGKCGGTGVFLPSEASSVRESNEAGGTAGSLLSQHLSVTSRKRNKSARHVQRGEKKDAVKDEESLPNELCLPKEWTY